MSKATWNNIFTLDNTENAREPAILLSIFTGIEMLKLDPFLYTMFNCANSDFLYIVGDKCRFNVDAVCMAGILTSVLAHAQLQLDILVGLVQW